MLWSGAIVDIPDGWALCDGTQGTPDLTDQFVVGAGDSYTVDETGGSVNHTHSFTGDGHTHSWGFGDPKMVMGLEGSFRLMPNSVTGTTDSEDGRPPYYALAYIMKLLDDPDPAFQAAFPYAAKAIVQFIMIGANLEIYLTFKHKMNVDNKPANGLWLVELDEVPDAVDTSTWLDPWTMKLDIDAPGAPPSNVTVEYDGPDENLATIWDKQWEPWGPIQGTDLS